jgi:hypothetical protein
MKAAPSAEFIPTGQAYLGHRPSKKSIKHAVEKIHALTDRAGTGQETTMLVSKLNRTLTKRTCRGRLTMSAPEGKTDVPREPGHFRFLHAEPAFVRIQLSTPYSPINAWVNTIQLVPGRSLIDTAFLI